MLLNITSGYEIKNQLIIIYYRIGLVEIKTGIVRINKIHYDYININPKIDRIIYKSSYKNFEKNKIYNGFYN